MIPVWLKDAIPSALALIAAAALWLLHLPQWSVLFLGVCIVVSFIYHQWMLGHLSSWAALPSRRDLGFRGLGRGGWGQVFDRLTRGYNGLKEENQTLRTELHSIHTAVDKINDALIVLDKYSHIEWANQKAQKLFGFVGSAGVNRPIHHYLRDPGFSAMLDRQFHSKSTEKQTLKLPLPGHPGEVYLLKLIPSDEGKQLLIARDITEQAKLDAVKSDFIANISHEIRTPLTVVSGYTETLLDMDLDKTEQQKHLQTILKQSQTMQNLVADLLMLSSLEQDQEKKPETAVEVSQLFADIYAEAKALSAGKHDIQFHIDHPAQITGIKDELESALRNLVSNAIRYTPEGGRMAVSFKYAEGSGLLSVQDSGMGIEANHLPRLTERFYRVDRGRSRGSGGTGLGLAIVKRIANRHQMDLEINSKIGVGSTFTLRIPSSRLSFAQSDASRQLSLT